MSKELIRRLREFDQPRLEKVYQNVFNTDEGQLVLEDLKGRFHEYVPPMDMTEVGELRVLIHLKNMVNPMEQEDAGAGA